MKIAGRILVVILLALLAVSAGAWLYLHESLPRIDGEVAAQGAAAPIEIVRDREGVPHIFARSARDGWLVFNEELRFPIIWRFRGVGLFDAGSAFATIGAVQPPRSVHVGLKLAF